MNHPKVPPVHRGAVVISGDLDEDSADDVRRRLTAALRASPDDDVVVDLSRVAFVDCAGLGVLLAVHDRLRVRDPAPLVRHLLAATGTGGLLRGEAVPEDPLWSDPLVTSTVGAVEHLRARWPGSAWWVVRGSGDASDVVAAAGSLPPRLVPPWPGPPAPTVVEVALVVAGEPSALLVGTGGGVGEDDGARASAHLIGGLLQAALGQRAALLAAEGAAAVARRLAEVDALTGLRNRRGWRAALDDEQRRRGRTGAATGVVVVDLDGLKAVNDRQGHAAGDALLVAAAGILLRSCRPHDVVARSGGDEYAVLALDVGVAGLERLCERIRGGLADAGVAASVAGACEEPDAGLAGAWERADRRMYDVKRAHRSGVGARPDDLSADPGAGTAARLAYIHEAVRAGLTPSQVRDALAQQQDGREDDEPGERRRPGGEPAPDPSPRR
ncbi:diguanylate cyclase [uncultured Pseudokineococcus sp.]|uniref:GGDEF domain-containing protein n=1 Tax=uncultured Pseudokineococcus sp. TaxID=1642928 RepID=UPI002624458E|nr:diguanylate cyclase [uncultured Pseudokineococcus sp.]